jgi:hypothetical protein
MAFVAQVSPYSESVRDSIGGHPFLPEGTPWPICPVSNQRMVLFFQFDIRKEFGLRLAPGSHLAVFMSPAVNEIDSFDTIASGSDLPDQFWKKRGTHFKVFLFDAKTPLVKHDDADAFLVAQTLSFSQDDDPSDPFLFVGGEPRWYQDEELHPGFDFICQLSENFPFLKQASAPKQPHTFSSKAYCLFLGNSMYLFAREHPLHEEDVWIVLQN